MLIEAIHEGNKPEVKARLDLVIDAELDVEHRRGLIEDRYLVHETLTTSRVREIRDQMDRAQVRRLPSVRTAKRDGNQVEQEHQWLGTQARFESEQNQQSSTEFKKNGHL